MLLILHINKEHILGSHYTLLKCSVSLKTNKPRKKKKMLNIKSQYFSFLRILFLYNSYSSILTSHKGTDNQEDKENSYCQ